MKFLILIFISFNIYAGQFVAGTKLTGVKYFNKQSCQSQEAELCYELNKECVGNFCVLGVDSGGNTKIMVDDTLKNTYEQAQTDELSKRQVLSVGALKRSKCKKALDYISGDQNSNTEAGNDLLEASFGSIQDALVKCRFKKAKRLISEVVDPGYQHLRGVLLELMN